MRRSVRLEVNGRVHAVVTDADVPLLTVLREDVGLSGPRFGCGIGECGACQVLVDGRPAASCDMPAWFAEGKAVTTVEGLPPALADSFVAEQAGQCGYCLSGVLVAAHALLEAEHHPDDGAVRRALDGNLCRCGSHNRIVRAVLRAAAARG